MTFGAPQFLYVLAALPALALFMWWALGRRAASLRRIGDPALVERLSLAADPRMRLLRLVLWFAGAALIIVALARPQWGSDIEIVEQGGVQVMVALDISRSMLTQDLKPTRLDRAKLEISDLISRLDGDEVGIVLFSGASFIQFPLTSDYATARTYLNHASPNAITRQGTVIAEAIETAMGGFSNERESQKIIVIMTDGENHEGDPIAAARQAAAEGVVIYTVGFGSPDGGPVPEYDEGGTITGYRQDAQGRAVVSRIDETALQQIADRGGGLYFRAAERGRWRAWERRFNPLRTEASKASSARERSSGFNCSCSQARSPLSWPRRWPTGYSSRGAEGGERRQREQEMVDRLSLLGLSVLALWVLACGPTPAEVNNSGHEPYLASDYAAALDAYQGAQGTSPESGEPHYNAGNVLYRMGEYEDSLQSYDEALKYAKGELRSSGFFNRGNASFQQQEYEQAVEAYTEVLRMNPDDRDAKHNLELALRQIPPEEQPEEQDDQQEEEEAEQEQDEQQDEEEQDDQQEEEEQEQDEPITEEQARQILESVGESAQTLQERRGQVLVSPKPPSEFDW